MARWQELYEMVLAGDLPPAEIMDRLNVKPSRLRQMLASKRLVARLALHEEMADRTHVHRSLKDIARAASRLSELTESDQPEAARRACRDVLTDGRGLRDAITKRKQVDAQAYWQRQYDSIGR